MRTIKLPNGQRARVIKVNRLVLRMIINGETSPVPCRRSETLQIAIKKALRLTRNTSRPIKEWQVRDANGVLLEKQRVLSDFKFKQNERLFLSLAIGAGGSIRFAEAS